MIFDCHRHIESDKEYELPIVGSNYIFNGVTEYREHSFEIKTGNTVSLLLDLKDHEHFVYQEFVLGKIQAFKVHSRKQRLSQVDYPIYLDTVKSWNIKIPIIVDAFYFGSDLEFQPSLSFIVALARQNPETPIVVAHSGGYELLRYFFHLRDLDNVYFDLSFSLQYLADSSLYLDLRKVLRFWDRKRIMFGSDFPYASPTYQWEILNEVMSSLSFSPGDIDAVAFSNAHSLFKRNNDSI